MQHQPRAAAREVKVYLSFAIYGDMTVSQP